MNEDAARTARRAHGSLEAEVLAVLHDAEAALTAADVLGRLGAEPLAYSTVRTVLNRACDKGLATRTRRGSDRGYVYAHADREPCLVARRMVQALTQSQADPDVVLARFADELSARDRQRLLALLAG